MNSKEKSLQQLKVAEHLLEVTFPLVKDPKLLIGIIHNLNSCLNHGMESIFPENCLVPKNLNDKIELLRKTINPPSDKIELIRRIEGLVTLHKESPIVFKRGNKQIICSYNYEIEIISVREIQDLIDKTKQFLSHIGVV